MKKNRKFIILSMLCEWLLIPRYSFDFSAKPLSDGSELNIEKTHTGKILKCV